VVCLNAPNEGSAQTCYTNTDGLESSTTHQPVQSLDAFCLKSDSNLSLLQGEILEKEVVPVDQVCELVNN
jgi:hypothetical protein